MQATATVSNMATAVRRPVRGEFALQAMPSEAEPAVSAPAKPHAKGTEAASPA